MGNVGRARFSVSIRPILIGLPGAAVVHALAALPWVILIVAIGLSAVEPELEESALLDYGPVSVLLRVTLRRAVGAIAAAALAVAVLTAGDMTVTDLLQIRTYAEEVYLQYSLGRGPGEAALVAVPPLVVLGTLILIAARSLGRFDPARMVSSFQRARLWRLGRWRIPCGLVLLGLIGNITALPLYSLVWRAGRVGGRATLGRPPSWSVSGLGGSLHYAGAEIWEPLKASLATTAIAATLTALVACGMAWFSRRSLAWRVVSMVTLALALATPGPVAGMALVLAYRAVPAVYDSPGMVVMAEMLRTLPYSLLILWPFLRSFPQEYLDAAAVDGLGHRASSSVLSCRFRDGRWWRPGQSLSRSGSASFRRPILPLPRARRRCLSDLGPVAYGSGKSFVSRGPDHVDRGRGRGAVRIRGGAVVGGSLMSAKCLCAIREGEPPRPRHHPAQTEPRPPGTCKALGGPSPLLLCLFGLSPLRTALSASLSCSSRWGPPPTKRRATLPSRPMMTVWGIAAALY